MREKQGKTYAAWLGYDPLPDLSLANEYRTWCGELVIPAQMSGVLMSAQQELVHGISSMLGQAVQISDTSTRARCLVLSVIGKCDDINLDDSTMKTMVGDGYVIRTVTGPRGDYILLAAKTDVGVLYAAFHFMRLLQFNRQIGSLSITENPKNPIRMLNHWDNMDGSIERGYAGQSIFFRDNRVQYDVDRVTDYARLLSSIGINTVSINNVNVHQQETRLITNPFLSDVANIAEVFRRYGIKVFLSVNFASPIEIGGLPTADPLDPEVQAWWKQTADVIYEQISDFGGFVVKADSEFRPGPFTYGRDHVDGANLLANALRDHGGLVVWRCFVYNCQQDWRDRLTDRARAAYDHFKPLYGRFDDNVILQIKNGPMDFQVREPVSPLIGAMEHTNQMLELQITQEYTGQQKHLCYLVPQWKEVVDFDTYAMGEDSTVASVVNGSRFGRPTGGFAAVSNVGDDASWTGHPLAQANLYGFGRLAWNPELSSEAITDEWVRATFGNEEGVVDTIKNMLLQSWSIYESYTAPLGVGWMVNPGAHYGPNVDGYEYSKWGTYHFADCHGIGVDRTVGTGTGYTGQYHEPHFSRYESIEACPDELLLFFHHVSYQHRLNSGKTVIQHIYDAHFHGVERAVWLKDQWMNLQESTDPHLHEQVLQKFILQMDSAREWRDVINTYFLRKSGIPDAQGRTIY